MNPTFPRGPLYDPSCKIINFVADEDFKTITYEALKTGILYKDPRPLPDLEPLAEWIRPGQICERPYFIKEKAQRFDAKQGDLSNCWLMVAIEGLTLNEQLFNHVVPPYQSFETNNYTAAFHFRFWRFGVWYDVVVDDRLPVWKQNKELCYAHSKSGDVFWAALLEKAYCKMSGRNESGYYDSLSMGLAVTGLQDLTGGIVETLKVSEPPRDRPLKWFLNEIHLTRALMSCSIYDEENPVGEASLSAEHGYCITNVFYTKDDDPNYKGLCLVRILNPVGNVEWSGEWSDTNNAKWEQIDKKIREDMQFKIEADGEFWMSEEDFAKHFTYINICYLGPGQYLTAHSEPFVQKWRTKNYKGEWIKDVSAGGSSKDKLYLNPQYMLSFKSPEGDPGQDGLGQTTVVIEVTQRSPLSRGIFLSVGFYIYRLDIEGDPTQLNKEFFDSNTSINDMDFSLCNGRSYAESRKLFPGWYCIIPCTENEGEETSFLLRIFTENNIDSWDYVSRISKSSPIEEETKDTLNYDELKDIFNKTALHGEVDWTGLKDILGNLLNSHGYKGKRASIEFSKNECRIMIAIMDKDGLGSLNYNEFCGLWKKIMFWCKVYDCFSDSEGYLKIGKLRDALSSIGFNLNHQVIRRLYHFYANDQGQIVLKDFILCGAMLETNLKHYNIDDVKPDFKFTLEEWVKTTLSI